MRIGGESSSYERVPVELAAPSSGPAATAASAGSPFLAVLQSVGHAVDRGEALTARASHGYLGGLDSGQLIALQVGIYRYSEAVDLVAKLVDRASTAVKTVVSPH